MNLGILPMTDDHLARFSHAAADIAEFAVAMGRLVQIHEVHVDRRPGQVPVELGVEMHEGLVEGVKPAIHILAGEKVCIQQTRPTQFSAALASRQTCRIESGVVTTGLHSTSDRQPGRSVEPSDDLAAILCDLLQGSSP